MNQEKLAMEVREVAPQVRVIDVRGEITAFSEETLMEAYLQASSDETKTVILGFDHLEYMNSGGIGLLVTLLIRANRNGQKLFAYGLNDHYRQIFGLTRLDEAIGIHETEAAAVAAS